MRYSTCMRPNIGVSLACLLTLGALLSPAASAAEKVTAEEFKALGLAALKEGTRSIDFTLSDLSGKKVSLSSFKGKLVFLNFWATWCPPCRAEMPSMERLHQKLKGKGLVILAVDLQEDPQSVQKFVDQYKLSFPVVLDADGRVGATYGARSIPTTYIIGRDGSALGGTIGGHEWDSPEMVAFFTRLLEAK
jgi:thiol-disulfide isomerase/thioredoxin